MVEPRRLRGHLGTHGDVLREAITLAWGLPTEEAESDPPTASIPRLLGGCALLSPAGAVVQPEATDLINEPQASIRPVCVGAMPGKVSFLQARRHLTGCGSGADPAQVTEKKFGSGTDHTLPS